MPELTIEYVAPATLNLHPENPRKGDVDAIAESLLTSGQYKPLVVSRATNNVLAGNHTLQAIEKLRSGWRPAGREDETYDQAVVAVTFVDVDLDGERRILAVDNRTSDLGTYDNDALVELLKSLETLEGSGYSEDDLDTLAFMTGQAHDEIEPGATDAHFNGTAEERAQHEANIGNYQPLKAQGLDEIILVLPTSKKDQLITWLQQLRGRWGVEKTNGELVYTAVGKALEDK